MAFSKRSKVAILNPQYFGNSEDEKILAQHTILYRNIEDIRIGNKVVFCNDNLNYWPNNSLSNMKSDTVGNINEYSVACFKLTLDPFISYPDGEIYVTGSQLLLREDGTPVSVNCLSVHDKVLGYTRYLINGELTKWNDAEFLIPTALVKIKSIEFSGVVKECYQLNTSHSMYVVNGLVALS